MLFLLSSVMLPTMLPYRKPPATIAKRLKKSSDIVALVVDEGTEPAISVLIAVSGQHYSVRVL